MKYRHKRTGKVVEVPDAEAFRYRNRRWELVTEPSAFRHQPAGQDWEPTEVPQGTIAEVLAWVGDNDLRRQSALTVERAGKNRKTLIDKLTAES